MKRNSSRWDVGLEIARWSYIVAVISMAVGLVLQTSLVQQPVLVVAVAATTVFLLVAPWLVSSFVNRILSVWKTKRINAQISSHEPTAQMIGYFMTQSAKGLSPARIIALLSGEYKDAPKALPYNMTEVTENATLGAALTVPGAALTGAGIAAAGTTVWMGSQVGFWGNILINLGLVAAPVAPLWVPIVGGALAAAVPIALAAKVINDAQEANTRVEDANQAQRKHNDYARFVQKTSRYYVIQTCKELSQTPSTLSLVERYWLAHVMNEWFHIPANQCDALITSALPVRNDEVSNLPADIRGHIITAIAVYLFEGIDPNTAQKAKFIERATQLNGEKLARDLINKYEAIIGTRWSYFGSIVRVSKALYREMNMNDDELQVLDGIVERVGVLMKTGGSPVHRDLAVGQLTLTDSKSLDELAGISSEAVLMGVYLLAINIVQHRTKGTIRSRFSRLLTDRTPVIDPMSFLTMADSYQGVYTSSIRISQP